MITKIIKCKNCSEVIGSISKPEFSEKDLEEIKEMYDCSLLHKEAEEVEE